MSNDEMKIFANRLDEWKAGPKSDLAAVADILVGDAASAIRQLVAENDRLRDALQAVLDEDAAVWSSIARAALKGDTP
jgi:hypothetical protein